MSENMYSQREEPFQTEAPQAEGEAAEASEQNGEKKKEKEKKSVGREILSWIGTILLAVVAAVLIRSLIFEFVRVDGVSMLDTLQNGEIMFVSKFDYSTTWLSMPWQTDEAKQEASRVTIGGTPARFDAVICRYPGRGDTNFVKRVVGLPGDTISFQSGYLYLNGEKQEEPYISDDYRSGMNNEMQEYTVPAKGDALVYEDGYLLVNGSAWRWRNGYITGVSKEGDRLTYNRGSVLLNGQEITYTNGVWKLGEVEQASSPLEAIEGTEFYLENDYYFVCGDHRNNSNDSRSVGPIERSMIVGHVRTVVYPFSAWRGVE